MNGECCPSPQPTYELYDSITALVHLLTHFLVCLIAELTVLYQWNVRLLTCFEHSPQQSPPPDMPSRSTSHTSSHQNDTLSPPSQRAPFLHHSTSTASNASRNSYHRPCCQQEECEHGLLSPHASRPNSASSTRPRDTNQPSAYTRTHLDHHPRPSDHPGAESGNGGVFGGSYAGKRDLRHGILGDAIADGMLGDGVTEDDPGSVDEGARAKWRGSVAGMSTTQWLAKKHGIKGRRTM